MTPDEVVKILQLILPKDKEFWVQVIPETSLADKPDDPNKISHIFEIKRALRTAITQIQDYQKLREKIDEGKILDILEANTEEQTRGGMDACGCSVTAIGNATKEIVTYLQQPTE